LKRKNLNKHLLYFNMINKYFQKYRIQLRYMHYHKQLTYLLSKLYKYQNLNNILFNM